MKKLAHSLIFVAPIYLLACSSDEQPPEPASAPAATPSVATAAPSPFTATKLAVPLSTATGEHVKAALVGGGWEMASFSVSGSITTLLARKNEITASVYFYNPAKAHHRGHLERDTKAIYAEGPALIGVKIADNDAAAQALLTSLIGHAPTAAAPVAAQTPVPASAPAMPSAAAPAAPPAATGSWDGLSPLVCSGAQQMVVSGVTANLPGATAITASGMCQLTLINCNITAGQAIAVAGVARIIIQGGKIEGSQTSIAATGGANVIVNGAQVVGPTSRSGTATITGVQ